MDAVMRVSVPPKALKMPGDEKKDSSKTEEEKAPKPSLTQKSVTEPGGPSFFRSRDPYGVYLDVANDPQARTNILFRAKKIILHSSIHFSAEDAFITADDMVHPMYGVKVGELDFYMRELPDAENPLKPQKIVAKRAQLNIFGVSLFPFPSLTYDFSRRNPYFSVDTGISKRWGPFGLFRVGYGLGGGEDKLFDPTHIYLDVDERTRRGPGGGFELDWQTGRKPLETQAGKGHPDRGEGHIRFYTIDEIQTTRDDDIIRARRDLERRIQPKIDGFPRREFDANLLFVRRRRLEDAGPPSFDIDEHRDEFRGLLDFQHHQPLGRIAGVNNLQLDFKYQRQSDRDFLLEYFQNNYMTNNQPEALVSVRKPGDNYSMELVYRGDPQDFDGGPPRSPVDYGTFSGYEPALTYSLLPMPLPYGFYLKSEMQAARLKRSFERAIYDQDGLEANRVYGQFDISRPIKFGAVNVVPHLGTQQQAYDNSRGGESVFQGALTYGLDVTSRFYGTFPDLENQELGIKGMRHIVEPRISYGAVGDTRETAENLLDFDIIDDLTPIDKITLALDQTLQTRVASKDGSMHTSNFAGLGLAVDYFPRDRDQLRLLHGDALDLFHLDGFLRVLDVVRFDAGLGVSLEDGELEKATYGITINPQTRWRLKFEERFNFGNQSQAIVGSDQFRFKFEYRLSERWGFAFEQISERRKSLQHRKGRQVERIALTRNYGALDATITYAIDRNVNDHQFYFSLRPTLSYRNLIVPSQDLLVGSAEVSGDEAEAPEERNYDPFELLKKRKKKAGGDKQDKSLPAPRSQPGGQDTPVPAPLPEKQVDAQKDDAKTTTSGVFTDPGLKPEKRSSKMDDDDWTQAPATPASAR